MNSDPILIIGGTRSTGLLAAQLLLRQGMPVRVLARNPALAVGRLGPTPEIVQGDLTQKESLAGVVRGARHILFTAGIRSGRFARERTVRATEYEGVLHTLELARRTEFQGRFVYMTSIGVTQPSLFAWGLNQWKGNTILWRRQAEKAIRESGLDYCIVRAAFLLNTLPGTRPIRVSQEDGPLTFRECIARADVAAALVAAADHPAASRTTFEIRWDRRVQEASWTELLDGLKPDSVRATAVTG